MMEAGTETYNWIVSNTGLNNYRIDTNRFDKAADNFGKLIEDHFVDDKVSYYEGKVFGDKASRIAGVAEVAFGGTLFAWSLISEFGGAGISTTGVGTVVGVPAMGVSAVGLALGSSMTVHGLCDSFSSVDQMKKDQDILRIERENGGSGGRGIKGTVTGGETLKNPSKVMKGSNGNTGVIPKEVIYNGGGIYDLDNIRIVTPRLHQEILDKGFHFNK
jgi:hypothetical protein